MPRALPADYARAGVTLDRPAGMPRAMPADYARYATPNPAEQGDGFDWSAALVGASVMLALVVAAAFVAKLVRRSRPLQPATFALLTLGVALAAGSMAVE